MPYAVQIALGMIAFIIIVAACIVVLYRTRGTRDQRVSGSALIGDEFTENEHLRNIENLQTQNQVSVLRQNGSWGP